LLRNLWFCHYESSVTDFCTDNSLRKPENKNRDELKFPIWAHTRSKCNFTTEKFPRKFLMHCYRELKDEVSIYSKLPFNRWWLKHNIWLWSKFDLRIVSTNIFVCIFTFVVYWELRWLLFNIFLVILEFIFFKTVSFYDFVQFIKRLT
jgi:hypothetical protein